MDHILYLLTECVKTMIYVEIVKNRKILSIHPIMCFLLSITHLHN